MLFPYDTQAELTPSAVKIQRENLKQFELANFDKIAIDQLIANGTAFYDQFLLNLWRRASSNRGVTGNTRSICAIFMGLRF